MIEFLKVIISWPLVIGLALWYLRKELARLLKNLSELTFQKVRVGGIEIDVAPTAKPPIGSDPGLPDERAGLPALPLQDIRDKTFLGDRVLLDGKNFVNCHFKGCSFEYRGEQLFGLQHCTFDSFPLHFSGPAANVTATLESLYKGMGPEGQKLVEGYIASIRGQSI